MGMAFGTGVRFHDNLSIGFQDTVVTSQELTKSVVKKYHSVLHLPWLAVNPFGVIILIPFQKIR